jgi:hypothetical protein
MCVSCGRGEPNERHGDELHITQSDLQEAATAAEISLNEVIQNIASSGQQAGTGKERQQYAASTSGLWLRRGACALSSVAERSRSSSLCCC